MSATASPVLEGRRVLVQATSHVVDIWSEAMPQAWSSHKWKLSPVNEYMVEGHVRFHEA